jgi:hypothetical protein
MISVKLGQIEKAENRVVSVAMTSALLVLLIISQLPPASDFLASRFTLESSYNLLEAEELENDSLDLDLPDFLNTPVCQLQDNVRYGAEFNLLPAGNEVHASFSNIRAPPDLS